MAEGTPRDLIAKEIDDVGGVDMAWTAGEVADNIIGSLCEVWLAAVAEWHKGHGCVSRCRYEEYPDEGHEEGWCDESKAWADAAFRRALFNHEP